MREKEFINEIGYALELGDLTIPDSTLIANSISVGNSEAGEVRKFSSGPQQLFFIEQNGEIQAAILVVNWYLRSVRNFVGYSGLVTALIGFVISRYNRSLIISADEGLTEDGIRWLLLMLRKPHGFKITDTNGEPLDAKELKMEWELAKNTRENGHSEIYISESAQYTKFRKRNEGLLMQPTFWKGDNELL